MNMVYFNQLHQTGIIAIIRNDKTAFALIVDVFIVKIAQFNKGFIRFFEPIAHHARVIIELVHKAQIFAFKGS